MLATENHNDVPNFLIIWASFILSHLTEANAVLQFIVLCLGVVSGVYLVISRYRRNKRGE